VGLGQGVVVSNYTAPIQEQQQRRITDEQRQSARIDQDYQRLNRQQSLDAMEQQKRNPRQCC
jgi:hypothetical protein